MSEYEVDISDWEWDDMVTPVMTRGDIVAFFNKAIKNNMKQANTVKGIEVDIPSEWREVLLQEYSLLDEYKKMGWKVMWYNTHSEGPGRGKLLRSWVTFWSKEFASKVR